MTVWGPEQGNGNTKNRITNFYEHEDPERWTHDFMPGCGDAVATDGLQSPAGGVFLVEGFLLRSLDPYDEDPET